MYPRRKKVCPDYDISGKNRIHDSWNLIKIYVSPTLYRTIAFYYLEFLCAFTYPNLYGE